jgi:hypothetical protein
MFAKGVPRLTWREEGKNSPEESSRRGEEAEFSRAGIRFFLKPEKIMIIFALKVLIHRLKTCATNALHVLGEPNTKLPTNK